MDEKDDNLKKNNNPKEADSTIILDETGSKNNIDTDVKTTRVSDDIGSKNDKETESVIVLDETRNPIIAIDDKDPKQTESAIDLDEAESRNLVILDENKTDSDSVIVLTDKADFESTIILDDDEASKLSKRNPVHSIVIDVDKDTDCSIVEASSSAIKETNILYDEIFKENSLLMELIEKCLNMENTYGMDRVINRTLLAIYKNVDDEYKKSETFRKVLTKTIMQIDLQPERKFSHLKNFCDNLKAHKTKKRVNFITLEGVSKDKQLVSSIPTKRRRVDTIIDLDDENETNQAQGNDTVQNNTNLRRPKEYPPIEIDDDSSSDDGAKTCDVILLDVNDNANKENNKKAKSKKTKKKRPDRPKKILKNIVRNPFHIAKRKSNTNQDSSNMCQDINRLQSVSDPGTLLEPRNTLEPESLLEPRLTPLSILEKRHTSELGSLLEPRQTDPRSLLKPRLVSDPGFLLEPRPTPGSILETRHTSELGSLLEPRHTDPRSLLIPRLASDPGFLLEPRHTSDASSLIESRKVSNMVAIESNKDLIKDIESRIAVLKKEVEYLEEMEVESDSHTSPYIRCEQVKATIVSLYKELCQLTGTEVTKRHEVRLQVVPGHPEGPVRCLEEFLNSNIDEDGNTPFPDMHDVIQCVCQANVQFNMNWGRAQIMNEAQALFIQYGRSMQKRRQRREWKDLMSLVKQEAPDPAEFDPALQARLLENSQLARMKENELLSRFAQMEQGLVEPTDPELRLSMDQSGDSEESDVETPETGDGISAVNPPAPDGASDNTTVVGLLGTVGSIVTVSGGNIVIQPTIKYGNGSIYHSLPNNNQQKTSSELSLVSSEFQSFLYKIQDKPITHELAHSEYVNITNRCGQTEVISSNNLAKENANVVNNMPSTQINENNLANVTGKESAKVVPNTLTRINENYLENVTKVKDNDKVVPDTPTQINENDLANITNLAKNILSLVQTDLCPKMNGIANEKNDLDKTNHCVALESTNFAKTNECNTNSVFKTNDGNLQCKQDDKTHENVSHIFTHSTKPKSKNDTGIIGSLDTPWEEFKDYVTYHIEMEETNNSVSEELKDMETFQTDIESQVENKEGIVKPEPLDIPSMLEDLGQGFTATIFDIEDPFLVIEISDSSESEDEENT